MNNLTYIICLTTAVLLGSAAMYVYWWCADFEKGLSAADNADYATALRELTPLTEQGDANAQYNLGRTNIAITNGSLYDMGNACNEKNINEIAVKYSKTKIPNSIAHSNTKICAIARSVIESDYKVTKDIIDNVFCKTVDDFVKKNYQNYQEAIYEFEQNFVNNPQNVQSLNMLRGCQSEKTRSKFIKKTLPVSEIYSVGTFIDKGKVCIGYLKKITDESSYTYVLQGINDCSSFKLDEKASNIFHTTNPNGVLYGNHIYKALKYDGEIPSKMLYKGTEYDFYKEGGNVLKNTATSQTSAQPKSDYATTYANSIKSNFIPGGHCDNFANMIDQITYSGSPTNVKVKQIDKILDSADQARCVNY